MSEAVLKNLPTWDLSALYPHKDSNEFKNDVKNVTDRTRRFHKLFEGKIADMDGDILSSAINEYEEIEETLGRLHSFAYLLYAENIPLKAAAVIKPPSKESMAIAEAARTIPARLPLVA